MRTLATFLALLVLSSSLAGQDRLGSASEAHPEAPPELAQLEFLLGTWKLHTAFRSPDGAERHTEARLEGTYILSGHGIQLVEVHTPEPDEVGEVGSTFVSTTIFHYDADSERWAGASVNSLGNRKLLDGEMKAGELVLSQTGKLFRNRPGRNRLTYFNITTDRFELRLDTYHPEEDRWVVGSYGYVATRIER